MKAHQSIKPRPKATYSAKARYGAIQFSGDGAPSTPERLAEARRLKEAQKGQQQAAPKASRSAEEAKSESVVRPAKRSRDDDAASEACDEIAGRSVHDGSVHRFLAGGVRATLCKRSAETEARLTSRAVEMADDDEMADEATPASMLDSLRHSTHPLDAWMRRRIENGKVKDDFTDQEYEILISIARDASRSNWGGTGNKQLRLASEQFRQHLSLRVGDVAPTMAPRGAFDPLVPDIGALQEEGLLRESRHFARRRYKKSSDPNIQTARRHWFVFCFNHAHISPVRPQPGLCFDAAAVEEDIARCFATFLARSVQGSTASQYISNWKRWHKSVTGWDPVSSSIGDMPMLSQTLAGIRAELPSKERQRFAHPTRLFKEWWAPLERPVVEGAETVMDIEPQDLSKYSTEQRRHFAGVLREWVGLSGISTEDLRNTIVATTMTAALMRVSEAIPEARGEQPPPTLKDLRFVWGADGRMAYAELKVLPLKKGRGVRKVPIKIPYSKGNVRAAFFLWLLTAIDPPISEADEASKPLFRYFSWESSPNTVVKQSEFRNWYQSKMKQSGIKHWRHYNTHSFRIGGATALLAAGCNIEQIKAMGRWDSVIAEIYARPTLQQTLRVGVSLDTIDATPFEDADDSFFDREAGISEQQAELLAVAMLEELETIEDDVVMGGDGDAE